MVMAVHDTLREVTTITVQQNEAGDTVKLVQVTDRTRAWSQAAVKDREVKVIVQTDTVVVERRDSVLVKTNTDLMNRAEKGSTIVTSLKWIFAIIVAVTILMIVVKIRGRP